MLVEHQMFWFTTRSGLSLSWDPCSHLLLGIFMTAHLPKLLHGIPNKCANTDCLYLIKIKFVAAIAQWLIAFAIMLYDKTQFSNKNLCSELIWPCDHVTTWCSSSASWATHWWLHSTLFMVVYPRNLSPRRSACFHSRILRTAPWCCTFVHMVGFLKCKQCCSSYRRALTQCCSLLPHGSTGHQGWETKTQL